MLAGITGTMAMILMFGLSSSYLYVDRRDGMIFFSFHSSSYTLHLALPHSMAVAARFMWGALNGNIGVAKAYLAEGWLH